ncbi:MAG TPA: AzlD domain-containing protein [Ktedonobacterales bacterium]|nr:AzlD domain-containing protein [Ktedonobacterales bacterium]
MSWQLWLAVIVIGAITLLTRASFIVLAERLTIPAPVQRALEFTPVAALTAIVALEVVAPSGALPNSPAAFFTPRLIAGAVAALIAWRTRNIVVTILAGMALLWALTFAFGALRW